MDKALLDAAKSVRIAEHMLTQTYPQIGETKLLLSVAMHLHNAYDHALDAALAKCKMQHTGSVLAKVNLVRGRNAARLRISVDMLQRIEEIDMIMREHKKSPVEFTRQKRFVICNDMYDTIVIDAISLRRRIADAKVFIQHLSSI